MVDIGDRVPAADTPTDTPPNMETKDIPITDEGQSSLDYWGNIPITKKTSAEAYMEMLEDGELGRLQLVALEIILQWDMEVMHKLREEQGWSLEDVWPTANEVARLAQISKNESYESVRKRVSEVAQPLGHRKCNVSGRKCSMRWPQEFYNMVDYRSKRWQ
tara:strand:+ start:2719 stop:3201 length:483 start_codon:yes stop_codon:yes gene_type:complete